MINKFIVDETYYKENDEEFHITYSVHNSVIEIEFLNKKDNRLIARKNGPARIMYSNCGNISWVGWAKENCGGMHKFNGPAIIQYDEYGYVGHLRWFNNAVEYTDEVEYWLSDNNMNWRMMTDIDFNRMWMEIT